MAAAAATGGSIVSALSSALGNLTVGQTLALGGHLTTSNEAKAMSYITAMKLNPPSAASYLALLGAIPNLPDQVMTWASSAVGAIGTPVFNADLDNALAALQTQLGSEGKLQQAFGI